MIMSSDWWYTQQIMEHLLGPSWLSLFHLVIVDAAKPRFFSSSENRKITKLDIVGGTPIYSGGSVVSWLFYMIMTLIMIKSATLEYFVSEWHQRNSWN